MNDEKKAPGRIIAVESNGKKTRTTDIAELFGALVDSVYEKPKTIKEAIFLRNDAFKLVASELGLAAKQAKRLHDLLAFYPDESEASGYGERYATLQAHYEKFGPLPYQVVYYLLRCALGGSYKKESRKQGRQNIQAHPKQVKRAAFIEWAVSHIAKGAQPQNIAAIRRLDGFDETWGTDETVKKWWRSIDNAPALKPGATRTPSKK